jgi:hypothetical protein
VLRLSISDERTKKMPKQLIAAAAAIVLCIATTATGTISVARGGGFGGGGISAVLVAEVTALAVPVSKALPQLGRNETGKPGA